MSAEQNSTENGTESAPANIFPLVAGVDLDSYDEYESGAIDQRDRCEHEARILAFGAIRRAAEVARWHDDEQHMYETDPVKADHIYAYENEIQADAIRRAIRAAIGSDKA